MKVQDMAQNLYSDTRGQSERPVTFTEAVIDGLAAGGGLYVPERIPELSLDEIGALAELPYAQRAARIYRAFDVDLPAETVEALMAQAYGDNFDDERICPITSLSADTHVLELWHGPTSAFKDMALQCLPRFFSASAAQLREQGKLDHDFLILVATSGDTGKAALEGFRDVDGVSIGVMYPDGGVSDIQFKQMATQRGRNVQVWGVRGNFDDCQTGAKNVFGDEAFAKKLQDEHRIALSSANSINWGRLMPQIVYYVSAYAQLAADGKLNLGDELDVCVPTGNFGNILAAYYAREMGVPIGRLICASNSNNVLTDFLCTGVYDRNRTFYNTMSPSMDILISSNLERLLFSLSNHDDAEVRGYMEELARSGRYEVSPAIKGRLEKLFAAGFCDDAQTQKVIGRMWQEHRYLIDPHTAVAFDVLDQYRRDTGDTTPTVVVSTASPFKFCDSVLGALGVSELAAGTAILDQLSQQTGVPIPAPLAALKDKTVRFGRSVTKEHMVDQVLEMLR